MKDIQNSLAIAARFWLLTIALLLAACSSEPETTKAEVGTESQETVANGSNAATGKEKTHKRPNFLIIIADDHDP